MTIQVIWWLRSGIRSFHCSVLNSCHLSVTWFYGPSSMKFSAGNPKNWRFSARLQYLQGPRNNRDTAVFHKAIEMHQELNHYSYEELHCNYWMHLTCWIYYTEGGWDKTAVTLQTKLSNVISWIKCMNFTQDFTEVCSKFPINNIPTLVQRMDCHHSWAKPSSEPMMISLLMHICIIRLQWVKVYEIHSFVGFIC